MPPVFRFAPSPNGYLHLGHAYSALMNAELARRCGGRLLLRVAGLRSSSAARCRRSGTSSGMASIALRRLSSTVGSGSMHPSG